MRLTATGGDACSAGCSKAANASRVLALAKDRIVIKRGRGGGGEDAWVVTETVGGSERISERASVCRVDYVFVRRGYQDVCVSACAFSCVYVNVCRCMSVS